MQNRLEFTICDTVMVELDNWSYDAGSDQSIIELLAFCPIHMQNIIIEHPKYYSILKDPFKLMDTISQSIHTHIQSEYPYLSLTKYLAIIMNTRQQEREKLGDYMERFKQEKSIVKIIIGENNWGSFVDTTN